MFTKREAGFTLIEMMVVITITTLFTLFAFSTVVGTVNVVDMGATVNDMDTQANKLLERISTTVTSSVLPVTTSAGSTFQSEVINDENKGFGKNGAAWLNALQQGVNAIPFAVMVDWDGSGDRLDADLRPYLGASLPSGQIIRTTGNYNGNYELTGNINGSLASLQPAEFAAASMTADFGAALDGHVADVDGNAFAVIRFAPMFKADGATIETLKESDLKLDLNENGSAVDTFMIGQIEIYYPASGSRAARTIPLSGRLVLVQANDPIFTLINVGGAAGHFLLRVRLVVCDRFAQEAKQFARMVTPALARYHETMVEVRNMGR